MGQGVFEQLQEQSIFHFQAPKIVVSAKYATGIFDERNCVKTFLWIEEFVPKINHDLVANVCERPAVVARCPVAAIRPAMVDGKPTLEVDEKKCICCGACYPPCPPMQINDPEHSKLAIWVGGNHSNARSKPSFQKLVAAGIPNNPPRWPEATAIVKKILGVYKEDARDWERINDWIDRIGWPRFFELTELPFTKFHIDNWRGSRKSLNASTHIRF